MCVQFYPHMDLLPSCWCSMCQEGQYASALLCLEHREMLGEEKGNAVIAAWGKLKGLWEHIPGSMEPPRGGAGNQGSWVPFLALREQGLVVRGAECPESWGLLLGAAASAMAPILAGLHVCLFVMEGRGLRGEHSAVPVLPL